MYVLVGLGNPDKQYDNTRHNAGFEVIDRLSRDYLIPVNKKEHKALVGQGFIGTEKVLLVKPQTYMNLSGEAVQPIMDYYGVPVENLIVFCDDVYLELGTIRIRKSGSAGGHNGLKNIIKLLGTDNFKRIRVGVGLQPPEMDLIAFVLSHFTKAERELLNKAEQNAAEAARVAVLEDMDKAMNLFNGKKA